MMLRSLVVAAAAAVAAADLAAERRYEAEPKVRMEPSVESFGGRNWEVLRRADAGDSVRLYFFLKHSDAELKDFEATLFDRADPRSANYGQWLSAAEVTERLAARPEAVDAVEELLRAYGAEEVDMNRERDVLRVELPAPIVEQLLHTELAVFSHKRFPEVRVVRAARAYHLPASVAEYVSFVGELVRLPRVDPPVPVPLPEVSDLEPETSLRGAQVERRLADSPFGSCGSKFSAVTPAVLNAQYGIPTLAESDVADGNSMAVAEFQYQFYDDADLKAFAGSCGTDQTSVDTTHGVNVAVVCKIGGCIEALLDIEYIGAMADPIPLSVYYSSSYSLLDWIDGIMKKESPELVHSVSYGNDEAQQTSTQYMQSVNTEFMKAGSMGVSILFASGDQGVWGREGVGSKFHPDFPAGSPYVTAVGGTDFATKSKLGEETTWSAGGGGFSDTFDTPDWQADAVKGYLNSGVDLPASSFYNAGGRAYPDVAALGGQVNPYFVSYGGGSSSGGVAGTSASCPVVASVFAQLNNLRLSAGKSSLGFLNPFIYQNGDAFNDVTTGENNANAGTGFKATTGWDPATGMGTPNFDKLKALVV
mmetsp:Transcript_1547/g.4224  ORF Transcript_1547/g.4224 Transcript_1547/m.4224 type:complete len:591 (-) Transcript_1547:119-1891(-)|eukprot:CAMPEP_0118858022 /NCGR_PEP_ID=MMETSP1163-20130328/4877_1 /TAXON_ID=124430 /ORGANISM="Phaeomonas parva, Strain CCMP2877" /LENGTH=590 /DNA_ID=CAMNT_0006791425 /DNA_START=108 /DNA_END=1880 /DNA_ORIENTATION=+